LFDLAAHQKLTNLPDLLKAGAAVSAGYSGAMGIPGPIGELVVGILICAIIPILYCIFIVSKKHPRVWPFSTWLLLSFFLGFKQAFVRSDETHLFSGLIEWILPACLAIMLVELSVLFPPLSKLDRTALPFLTRPAGLATSLTILLTIGGLLAGLR